MRLYGLDPNYGGLNIDAGTVYVPSKTAVVLGHKIYERK